MITQAELTRWKGELERLPAVIEDTRRIVRRERANLGLSMRAAAAWMQVPPTTLARFEKGATHPDMDTLLAVVRWITQLPTEEGSSWDC